MYDSHPPQSVKRGIVKCFYESAKRLATQPPPPPPITFKEKKLLSSILVSDRYPSSLVKG